MFNRFIGMKIDDVKRILEKQSVSFSIIDVDSNPKGNQKLVVKVDGDVLYVQNFLIDVKEE